MAKNSHHERRRLIAILLPVLLIALIVVAVPVGIAWHSHDTDATARDELAAELKKIGIASLPGTQRSGVSSIPYGSDDCGVWATVVVTDSPNNREALDRAPAIAVLPVVGGRLLIGTSAPTWSGWKALADPRCWTSLPAFIDRHDTPR